MNQHNIVIHTQAWCVEAQTRQLTLMDKTLEPLANDEVQIENRAIGLNPVDFKVINNGVLSDGQVAGVDGAGMVTAVGSSELSHLIGTRVAYHQNLHLNGSFAKHINIKAKVIIPLPNKISFEVAASLPCPLLTAWQAVDKLPIKPNRTVLVSGASGAVGRYLIQLLKHKGFNVVATANPNRHPQLEELGAQQCFSMDETFSDRTFFAVIDTRSRETAKQLALTLQANGHLVSILGRLEEQPLSAFERCISLHEIALGALHQEGLDSDWQELTSMGTELMKQISNQQIIPNPIHMMDFAKLDLAINEFEHQRKALKYVIQC